MIGIILENWMYIGYIIPFLATYYTYKVSYMRSRNERIATHQSVYISTFFYVFGVMFIIKQMFGQYYFGFFLIGFIIFLSLVLIMQWKKNTEVLLFAGVKLVIRFSFLLFLAGYIGLILYNIGKAIYFNYIM